MKNEHISDIIPEYLEGLLSSEQKDQADDHLASCADCTAEMEDYKTLLKSFQNEEMVTPSLELKRKLQRDIENEKSISPSHRNILSRKLHPQLNSFFKIAASVALLTGAFFFGKQQQKLVSDAQFAQLALENIEHKQTAMLSLIGNRSASKRIQGVNFITELPEPDEAIVKALTERMIHDENTNVRSSAVEVLSEFTASNTVKNSFIDALRVETDPGIQISIIKILGEIQEKRAAVLMKELLENENVQPYVKDELESVLPNII